ncbi:MAG: rare lipoprotein [Abditibacteriota bacterium]|nr:rare lipoprotein [Abditibacteriota bacterium]
MTIRKMSHLLGLALVPLALAKTVDAKSGQAAYHLHTNEMVTASRYEPRGSVLRVTNPQNGNSVVVRVNDRGPFNGNRILDLSTGAFRELYGGLGRGVGPMSYEVLSRGGSGGSTLSSRGGKASSRKKRSSSRRKYRRTRNHRRHR